MSKAPFHAATSRRGNVHILTLSGEIDVYVDVRLTAVLDEAVLAATSCLVIDLRDVRYMDSSGFRRLVRTRDAVAGRGDYFAVVVAPGIVTRLFEILQLGAVMPIFGDLEAAVAAAEQA